MWGSSNQQQMQAGYNQAQQGAMQGMAGAQSSLTQGWFSAQQTAQGHLGTAQAYGQNTYGQAQAYGQNMQQQGQAYGQNMQQQGQAAAAGSGMFGGAFGGAQPQAGGPYQPRAASDSSVSGFFGSLFGGAPTAEDKRDETYVNLMQEISYAVEDYNAKRASPKDIMAAIDERLNAIKQVGSVDQTKCNALLEGRGLNAAKRMELQNQIAQIRKSTRRCGGICC